MATRSRTYKTTDWKVWVYTPVAGKFRLDFSALDGADVLSSTDGTMSPIAFDIEQLTITNGAPLTNSVISVVAGSTASIELRTKTVSKTTMAELYAGKKIVITLKNEETTRTHAIYGQATPMFTGFITEAELNYVPGDTFQTISVEAMDAMQYVLNTQVTISRSTSYSPFELGNAQLSLLYSAGLLPADCFKSGVNDGNYPILWSCEGTGTQTTTYGDIVNGTLIGTAGKYFGAITTPMWAISATEFGFSRELNWPIGYTSWAQKNTVTIPTTNVYNVQFANNAKDKPTVMELTTPAGNSFGLGIAATNSVNNVVSYSAEVDTDVANLATIVSNAQAPTNAYVPASLDVIQAYNNQTITFTNDRYEAIGYPKLGYFWPELFANIQNEISVDLSALGFSSDDGKSRVVGQTITVTPDAWTTTYQLRKQFA